MFMLWVDYDGPGSPAGAVLFHDFRKSQGLGTFGGMGHGYLQSPLQLIFKQFVLGIYLTSGRPSDIQLLMPDDR